MDQADRKTFAIELGILAEILLRGESLSPARIEAYFEDLSEFPVADVREAIRACRRTCLYFPPPAEIIEAVRGVQRARRDSRPSLRPAPPSDEEQRKVHELIQDTIRKIETGESLR